MLFLLYFHEPGKLSYFIIISLKWVGESIFFDQTNKDINNVVIENYIWQMNSSIHFSILVLLNP